MLNVTKLFLFAFFLLMTHSMWGQTFEFQIVKIGKNNLTAIEQAQTPDNFLLNFADTANRLRIINKTDETQKVARPGPGRAACIW